MEAPGFEHLYHQAVALLRAGDARAAAGLFSHCAELQPANAGVFNNLGLALMADHRFGAAIDALERALALKPDYARALNNRGLAEFYQCQYESALRYLDAALALDPQYVSALINRANVLGGLGQWDAALTTFEAALAIDPRSAEALTQRGNLRVEMDQTQAALADFDQALAVRPTYADAALSRSLAHLRLGDYQLGWLEFESRWNLGHSQSRVQLRRFVAPLWSGRESLVGRTILLHAEQGLGDTIQFCRYAALVAARGARVILEVPTELADLLQHLPGVERLIVCGEPLPPFDFHAPLMSLPLAFGTVLATIPAQVPYVSVAVDRARHWEAKLGPKERLRVGLVWSGGFRADRPELWAVNNRRNIPLSALSSLASPRVEFYSLQKGEPARSELARLASTDWDGPPPVDLTDELSSFADTAALISQLDLVISVDTSTAHVAGALGKPVWLLNRFDSCWRWLLGRSDSPWYPTVRIYRQERAGDWAGVLVRVRQDLLELSGA